MVTKSSESSVNERRFLSYQALSMGVVMSMAAAKNEKHVKPPRKDLLNSGAKLFPDIRIQYKFQPRLISTLS